jgi:preprotein translocase subunit Sss1
MPHCGVTIDDPRNAGVIAYFRPKPVTRESLLRKLTAASAGKPPSDLLNRVERVLELARRPSRPDPPLSQSLNEVADPWFGLGTHPDIIEALWKLDDALPQRCRWVLWGRPALVHPDTGIVFAVGFGTIGFVLRLTADILRGADPKRASVIKRGNPGQTYDIASAGPEWRFIALAPSAIEWCGAAYDFAGEARS